MDQIRAKLTILIIVCSLLISCETKTYEDSSTDGSAVGGLNEGTFHSQEYFAGASSLTSVSDSTVTVNWDEVAGAVQYYVYIVDGGTENLFKRVDAPASFLIIDNLESGKDYSFKVRIRDDKALLDDNDIELNATTLSGPLAPYYLFRSNPIKGTDANTTPSFLVFGVNPGDTVKLYTDSLCSTEVASDIAVSSFIELTSITLPVDVNYTFYAKRINHKAIASACSTATVSYDLKTCPSGYVEIPANAGLALDAFCVMKYEARAWGDANGDNIVDPTEVDPDGCNESGCTTENWGVNSYYPGSTAEGLPWRMLSIEQAKVECQSLGIGYDLISNAEWMAMAEDLENQNANWSGAVVGTGCLFRGNNGTADACGYAKGAIDSGAARDNKARLFLSNGSEIWDVAGNVTEWIDWDKQGVISLAPTYCTDTWTEINTDICDDNLTDLYFLPRNPAGISPSSTYDSSYGLGKFEGGSGGAATRGGSYQYADFAGVFGLSLSGTLLSAQQDIGFRCVYRK